MIGCSSNRMGTDQHFEHSLSFNVVNSRTGNAVTINDLKKNGVTIPFTQSGKVVTITVPVSGMFTITVTAENYIDFSGNYSFSTLNNSSINMTEEQGTKDMEINVTWIHSTTQTNRDIDTFTYAYSGSTEVTKVYHGQKTFSDENTSITLDKDDQGSSDGENVTIQPIYDGYRYHVYLKDYTTGTTPQSANFANWACTVRVTYGGQVVLNTTAPSTARGRYWDIMTVNNGVVSTVNSFTDTEPIY